jgi:hypothetical protein
MNVAWFCIGVFWIVAGLGVQFLPADMLSENTNPLTMRLVTTVMLLAGVGSIYFSLA